MRKVIAVTVFLAFVTMVGAEPKNTIKEIMHKAHDKDALRAKVLKGAAEKAEKEELLALYKDLAENKPPMGDEKAWKKKTDAIVKAAQDVVDGKKGAEKTLNTATSCAACHGAHKPKS